MQGRSTRRCSTPPPWLTADFGLSPVAASHLMGQAVRYDVGNVFDPAYTMVCRLEKKWLPKRV